MSSIWRCFTIMAACQDVFSQCLLVSESFRFECSSDFLTRNGQSLSFITSSDQRKTLSYIMSNDSSAVWPGVVMMIHRVMPIYLLTLSVYLFFWLWTMKYESPLRTIPDHFHPLVVLTFATRVAWSTTVTRGSMHSHQPHLPWPGILLVHLMVSRRSHMSQPCDWKFRSCQAVAPHRAQWWVRAIRFE